MTTRGTTQERPTHCKHGHGFTPKNTRINRNADGSFRQYVCRTCARETQRRAVERKRESMTPDEWAAYIDARRATARAKDRAARRAQGIKSRAEIAAVRARERKAQTAESAVERAGRKAKAARERERDREAARAQRAAERAFRAAERAAEKEAERARRVAERETQRIAERDAKAAARAATKECAREAKKAEKIRARQEREAAAAQARRERDELAEQNRQDEQEAIMTKARREHTQRYAAHVTAGPFPIVDALVRVPATCRRGHELTARTVHLSTRVVDGETVPGGVECIRCLREDCYRAHYRSSAEVPAEILDEGEFCRQPVQGGHLSRSGHPWATDAGWWTRVEFASGWGFCDPDPTPELRTIRQDAQSEAVATRAEQYLDEVQACRDARPRGGRAPQPIGDASSAAIRAAMTAARGGVAV